MEPSANPITMGPLKTHDLCLQAVLHTWPEQFEVIQVHRSKTFCGPALSRQDSQGLQPTSSFNVTSQKSKTIL